MDKYAVLCGQPWNQELADELTALGIADFTKFSGLDDESIRELVELAPLKLFVPHWSQKIPASVFNTIETVIFHMTNLPYGRGGSPLQNLIIRGHRETVICALKCVEKIDGGPVYLRQSLSLTGSAEEILTRASVVIKQMITRIVLEKPDPIPQSGMIVRFKRRTPAESQIPDGLNLRQLYDFIRMLDAPGYPTAFMVANSMKIEFCEASLRDDSIVAQVRISEMINDG